MVLDLVLASGSLDVERFYSLSDGWQRLWLAHTANKATGAYTIHKG